MTLETLLKQIEIYYGKYSENIKPFVIAYLTKEHNPNKYDEILKCLLYYHLASYNAPCIASIEESLKKARIEKGITDTHKVEETKNVRERNYRKELKDNPNDYNQGDKLIKNLVNRMKKQARND